MSIYCTNAFFQDQVSGRQESFLQSIPQFPSKQTGDNRTILLVKLYAFCKAYIQVPDSFSQCRPLSCRIVPEIKLHLHSTSTFHSSSLAKLREVVQIEKLRSTQAFFLPQLISLMRVDLPEWKKRVALILQQGQSDQNQSDGHCIPFQN